MSAHDAARIEALAAIAERAMQAEKERDFLETRMREIAASSWPPTYRLTQYAEQTISELEEMRK